MAQVPENKLLRLETLCTFFDKCLNAKPADRVKHFKLLLEKRLNRSAEDLFQVIRLILPTVRWHELLWKVLHRRCLHVQGWQIEFVHRWAPLLQSSACHQETGSLQHRSRTARLSEGLLEVQAVPVTLTCTSSSSPLFATQLDRQRGNFQLKETALAAALVRASGLDKSHADANNALNWRQHTAKTAGNFAKTMEEVRACIHSVSTKHSLALQLMRFGAARPPVKLLRAADAEEAPRTCPSHTACLQSLECTVALRAVPVPQPLRPDGPAAGHGRGGRRQVRRPLHAHRRRAQCQAGRAGAGRRRPRRGAGRGRAGQCLD